MLPEIRVQVGSHDRDEIVKSVGISIWMDESSGTGLLVVISIVS